MAFVQLQVCTDRQGNDACGTCRPCRLFSEGRHPDLINLEPDGRFIKIDQVRQATRRLRYPPVEAAVRAIIIHQAHSLHPAAGNALLKTLEEPSPNNIFILLTAQPNLLLTTIRSRCQEVRFTHLQRETVAQWLRETHGQDADTADEVAAMSGGSLGAALSLADAELDALRQEWLRALPEVKDLSTAGLVTLAEAMSADRKAIPVVLDVLRIGLRDALLSASGLPDERLTFRRRGRILPEADSRALLGALSAVDEAENALLANVNARLVAEHLLLSLRSALR